MIRRESGRIVVSGPVTLANVAAVLEEGRRHLEEGVRIVDLGEVTEMDSSLLAAIVAGLFGRVIGRVASHSITILGVAASCGLSGYVAWLIFTGQAPVYNDTVGDASVLRLADGSDALLAYFRGEGPAPTQFETNTDPALVGAEASSTG